MNIAKYLQEYLQMIDTTPPDGNMRFVRVSRELEELQKISQHKLSMLNRGGEWLASSREWVQTHATNGETITCGSNELLQLKPLTMREFEELAARIALATLRELLGEIK